MRVGQEGSISDRLLPYHAARVEIGYKQKLQADLKNRMRVAARNLGISAAASDDLLRLHQSIDPVWIRLREVMEATEDGSDDKRAAGLRRTVLRMAGKFGAGEPEIEDAIREGRLMDALVQHIASKHEIGNLDVAERFASIFKLTADLIGSVSHAGKELRKLPRGNPSDRRGHLRGPRAHVTRSTEDALRPGRRRRGPRAARRANWPSRSSRVDGSFLSAIKRNLSRITGPK
ncbi:hypothetical protein BRDID11002_47210 [Bradyrhizobium diazoefficiens]